MIRGDNPEQECKPLNWKRDEKGTLHPVHQHQDFSWWWYDETWTNEIGPYRFQEEAQDACERYCREVLG